MGEKMKTVTDFIFLGSKIIVDSDFSHEIERCLLLEIESVLKSRDIDLPTKVHIVKTMIFPAVMYGFESWTIKKLSAEELMLSNCGTAEDSWESLGLKGDQTTQS